MQRGFYDDKLIQIIILESFLYSHNNINAFCSLIMLLGFLNIPSLLIAVSALLCVIGYGYDLIYLLKKGENEMEMSVDASDTIVKISKPASRCEKTTKAMHILLAVGNLGECKTHQHKWN